MRLSLMHCLKALSILNRNHHFVPKQIIHFATTARVFLVFLSQMTLQPFVVLATVQCRFKKLKMQQIPEFKRLVGVSNFKFCILSVSDRIVKLVRRKIIFVEYTPALVERAIQLRLLPLFHSLLHQALCVEAVPKDFNIDQRTEFTLKSFEISRLRFLPFTDNQVTFPLKTSVLPTVRMTATACLRRIFRHRTPPEGALGRQEMELRHSDLGYSFSQTTRHCALYTLRAKQDG